MHNNCRHMHALRLCPCVCTARLWHESTSCLAYNTRVSAWQPCTIPSEQYLRKPHGSKLTTYTQCITV